MRADVWTVWVLAWACTEGRPLVEVGPGSVLGVEEIWANVTYNAFRAIPYAAPPVATLRFKDPVAAAGWQGELDGALLPPLCPQSDPSSQEDCLYLNIYTPLGAPEAQAGLAVMVYLHGGGLKFGPEPGMDLPGPLVAEGVLVVVVQYRLGVLGFLSTEDEAAPGNLGLKDQTMALVWVKDHIQAFGGDPDRVTVFGESAGAHSVHWQLMAPSAAGLFRAAIMQSGSALCVWARGTNHLQVAQQVALRFGCPTTPTQDLVTCLQNVDSASLASLVDAFNEWLDHPNVFGPRVDGVYIPDEPATLLREGRYHHVPSIMGSCREDGSFQTINWYNTPGAIDELVGNFSTLGPLTLELTEDEEPEQTATQIFQYYLPDLIIDQNTANNASKLNGHRFYQVPIDWAAETQAVQTPVFLYELQHRGQYGNMDQYLQAVLDLPVVAEWVSHADDLQYLFEWMWGPLQTQEDLAVRKVFTATWTNFAKILHPTPDASLGFTWEQAGPDLRHLSVTPQPVMQADLRVHDRHTLWDTLPIRENVLLHG